MVIEIPSNSEPSDATVIFGFPIEEESLSPEIHQLQQEPETDPMVRTQKQLANVVAHAIIPTLRSRAMPTSAEIPPANLAAAGPTMEVG